MTEPVPAAPAAAPAETVPPVGAVAIYSYEAAAPTPGPRSEYVLVVGHNTDSTGAVTVLGLPLGHVDEVGEFRPGQLAPPG